MTIKVTENITEISNSDAINKWEDIDYVEPKEIEIAKWLIRLKDMFPPEVEDVARAYLIGRKNWVSFENCKIKNMGLNDIDYLEIIKAPLHVRIQRWFTGFKMVKRWAKNR